MTDREQKLAQVRCDFETVQKFGDKPHGGLSLKDLYEIVKAEYRLKHEYPLFLLSEIDRLEQERSIWERAAEAQKDNNIAILRDMGKVIKGLQWYADLNNYKLVNGSFVETTTRATSDSGNKARTTLKELGYETT